MVVLALLQLLIPSTVACHLQVDGAYGQVGVAHGDGSFDWIRKIAAGPPNSQDTGLVAVGDAAKQLSLWHFEIDAPQEGYSQGVAAFNLFNNLRDTNYVYGYPWRNATATEDDSAMTFRWTVRAVKTDDLLERAASGSPVCPAQGCPPEGQTCPPRYNQCPPLCAGGAACPTKPGTKQGAQCQSRDQNPMMPIFHVMGNFTNGDGQQPVAVNDISSVFVYKSVVHVFHQFGQCGWAHALSYDGAHWKNARYPMTPNLERDAKFSYDACGCYDGSITLAADVNDGAPVMLYSPSPSVPLSHNASLADRPFMAAARPSDLDDLELRHWTKDADNPCKVTFSDLGQIWYNKAHHRYEGLSNGKLWSTNDSRLHSWGALKPKGFPGGGSGGQWFQALPPTVDGTPLPPGSPTHLISTGNGQVYSAGIYAPATEVFKAVAEGLLLDSGRKNGRSSYTWATLQCSGEPRRCFSTAWLSPAASALPGPKSPNSALSIVRSVFWDPETSNLITLPMSELALLHNATLFSATAVHLEKGKLFTPWLPLGTGATIDLVASFATSTSAASFGVAALANNDTTLNSAMITVKCAARAENGGQACTASGGIAQVIPRTSLSTPFQVVRAVNSLTTSKPPPPPPGTAPAMPPPWPGSRLVKLSRIMPNISISGGAITGDATVPTIDFCQQSCDNETLCQLWSAFTVTGGKNWRCTQHTSLEKCGCPVASSSRGAVSGAKVPGEQRCSTGPHGFMAPRLEWSQAFTMPTTAKTIDVRVLVDRSIVEVFVGGGRVAAVMDYQPPNDVSAKPFDLASYQNIHLFAEQTQQVTGINISGMGCGWNISRGT